MKSSTTYASDLTTIGDGTQHMIGYAQNAQTGYIEAPTNAQQQEGVVPLDRLPAQWWNWFLNKATRRFTESEDFLENAVAELDNVLDVMGITPDPTSTTQLKTMFSSNYLQQYLPKIAAQASAFSVDGTHENYIPVADNDGNNGHTLVKVPYAPSLVVNTQLISTAKNITLPANCPYNGQTIKVVFANGHQAGSASDHMSLNVNNGLSPAPIVSNQNGTLDYLPIHELTAGTYSVLQANTVLEMYYTETGFSGNPAWVIVGNPVVFSSSTYTIYANGLKRVDTIQDGNMGMATSNAVSRINPWEFNDYEIITSLNRHFVYSGHNLTWSATKKGLVKLRCVKHSSGNTMELLKNGNKVDHWDNFAGDGQDDVGVIDFCTTLETYVNPSDLITVTSNADPSYGWEDTTFIQSAIIIHKN